MHKKIFIVILALAFTIQGVAQESRTIIGKVIDANSGKSIAFVNIGIEGTLMGTASNSNGEFTLKVPAEYTDKNLYFSAIGYENLIRNANTVSNETTIRLRELTYGIEDIEISTQSKVLYRIIRDAASNSREQFLKGPFNYITLYQHEEYWDKQLTKKEMH